MRSLAEDMRAAARGELPVDPVRELREAVVRHLRDLCATPRGSALLTHGYGVADPTRLFHEYPASAMEVQRDLLAAIQRYEPRLTDVAVTLVPTNEVELLLRLEVEGTLVAGDRRVPIRFSTVIDSDRVSVR